MGEIVGIGGVGVVGAVGVGGVGVVGAVGVGVCAGVAVTITWPVFVSTYGIPVTTVPSSAIAS